MTTLPKRIQRLADLATAHGWEVVVEDDGEVLELHAQRFVPSADAEVVWTISFARPSWRCLDRSASVVSADGIKLAARRWRALTHVEHWLARPTEVLDWEWVRAAV